MTEVPTEFPAIEIETVRLVLRAAGAADIGPMALLANDQAVASMTARMPYPYGRHDAEAFIGSQQENRQRGRELALAMERKGDGAFVGCVGLVFAATDCAEIGYWVGRPFWRNGFATEAARALIDHAFETTALDVVTGNCRVINEPSRRVLEKCGLRYVTSGLAPAPARGGALPVDRFRLTRHDWESFKAWRPATVRASSGQQALCA